MRIYRVSGPLAFLVSLAFLILFVILIVLFVKLFIIIFPIILVLVILGYIFRRSILKNILYYAFRKNRKGTKKKKDDSIDVKFKVKN